MGTDAAYWLKRLKLTKHPEGGSFRETYRSDLTISKKNLPNHFSGIRNFCTSIYFLLEGKEFSALHRLGSDEIWHFYAGDPLIVYEIVASSGKLIKHRLGKHQGNGEIFQTVIRAGNWFGCRLSDRKGYSLVGCTVAPGFDFEDFELGERGLLIPQYPQHEKLIKTLTR